MSTEMRTTYVAEYDYPGSFMPESTSRSIAEPTLDAALTAQPDEKGWFHRDGFYAITIKATTSKRFYSADGEETWVNQNTTQVAHFLFGEVVSADDLPDDDRHRILKLNLQNLSPTAQGVHTRRGNWQPLMEDDHVVEVAS